MTTLDRDRFMKCRTLADRGATPGERDAGRAAAARVAGSAGMTFEEASRLVDGVPRPSPRLTWPPAGPPAGAPYPYRPWRKTTRKPGPKPGPKTVADVMAKKAADLERRKKGLAREERKQEELRQEIERLFIKARAEQAVKDREWAEARARGQR